MMIITNITDRAIRCMGFILQEGDNVISEDLWLKLAPFFSTKEVKVKRQVKEPPVPTPPKASKKK